MNALDVMQHAAACLEDDWPSTSDDLLETRSAISEVLEAAEDALGLINYLEETTRDAPPVWHAIGQRLHDALARLAP